MTVPENTKQLAELLHTICCGLNHTDQCGWYYEGSDGSEHKHYKACACKLIDRFGFQTACDMIVSIRKIQFGERVADI